MLCTVSAHSPGWDILATVSTGMVTQRCNGGGDVTNGTPVTAPAIRFRHNRIMTIRCLGAGRTGQLRHSSCSQRVRTGPL